jgi:Matrixin
MATRCRLTLESLEDRTVPATFGIPWPNPGHVTLSFVPDCTRVGNQQSQLFRLLDAVAPTQTWQLELLRAFQTWSAPTNLNLSVVADSGDALGTTGPLQGDPRFGDIRISAVPLPADVVAFSMPFDPTAGTWAGDVELNSNYLFGIGGSALYDLFSVALHEAGHAFGIDGSTDPASPMFQSFTGTRNQLTPSDVSAIEALYGARTPDAFDAASSNGTLATATSVNLSNGGNGLHPIVVDANIATPADVDVYRFNPGSNQTQLTIQVQTSGISLLTPRLTVYGPSGAVLATGAAGNPLNGDLSVTLNNVQAGATYYVQVTGGGDVFGVGSYRLQILPNGVSPVSGPSGYASVVLPNDGHTNDTLGTATDLRQNAFRTDARFSYSCQAGIGDASDVDYYHILSPQGPNGSTTVLRAMVWGTDVGGLEPILHVFDAHGNAVAADVLMNENGDYVVQVANALPNVDYYVSVAAEHPAGLRNTGNYFLGIDFSSKAVNLQTFTSGTLSDASRQDFRTLQVTQSQLFHFALAVDSGAVPVDTAVKMTVYDQAGNVVTTLTSLNGEVQSTTLFLAPGTYTIRFAGGTRTGAPLPPTAYVLHGLSISDPVGPQATDPTLAPSNVPPPPTPTDLGYYWLDTGYYTALALNDPSAFPSW